MHKKKSAQLNINSIRNTFDQLKGMVTGNIDILILTETKLNNTFRQTQFSIDGYSKPYRLDRSENGRWSHDIYKGRYPH